MKRFILAWLDVDVQIKTLFNKVNVIEKVMLNECKDNQIYANKLKIAEEKLEAQIDINTKQNERFNKIEQRMDKVFE